MVDAKLKRLGSVVRTGWRDGTLKKYIYILKNE